MCPENNSLVLVDRGVTLHVTLTLNFQLDPEFQKFNFVQTGEGAS